jgi:hypothetical protein
VFPPVKILGIAVGEMIGVGIGTHLGNGSRGSLGADIGVAIAAQLAFSAFAAFLNSEMAIIAVFGGQTVATALAERFHRENQPLFRIWF